MLKFRPSGARWMHGFKGAALLSVLVLALPAGAQNDAVQTKRAAPLRQAPAETAELVSTLPAQAALTRLPERQGPWMKVKTDTGQTGWVHMFDVGAASASAGNTAASSGSAGSNALRSITSLFGRPASGTTTATSTIGIRGLGAEDIANAQPNVQLLSKAESLRSDETQARRFAQESQWTARAVEPLPQPGPPSPAGASGGTP